MGDKSSYVGIAGPGLVGLVLFISEFSQVLKVEYERKKIEEADLKKSCTLTNILT